MHNSIYKEAMTKLEFIVNFLWKNDIVCRQHEDPGLDPDNYNLSNITMGLNISVQYVLHLGVGGSSCYGSQSPQSF